MNLDGLGWWNVVARAIAVDPSRRLQSCCPVLECDSLVVVWVASYLVVMMEGILIMGSPLDGLRWSAARAVARLLFPL